jgi:hypothetical protein
MIALPTDGVMCPLTICLAESGNLIQWCVVAISQNC